MGRRGNSNWGHGYHTGRNDGKITERKKNSIIAAVVATATGAFTLLSTSKSRKKRERTNRIIRNWIITLSVTIIILLALVFYF